jgi:hypothetical protein
MEWWAKGNALHHPIETSILESLQSIRVFFFLDGPIKMGHCKQTKQEQTCEAHPQ